MMTDEEITVRSGARATMTFTGSQLAHVSTDDGNKGRWTEMTIYRKSNGGYVLSRIGRSIVFHRPVCEKIRGRTDLVRVEHVDDLPNGGYACEVCDPQDPDGSTDYVVLENDKNRAVPADTAQRLITVMQEKNRFTDEMFISPLSHEILMAAGQVDDQIAEAASRRIPGV